MRNLLSIIFAAAAWALAGALGAQPAVPPAPGRSASSRSWVAQGHGAMAHDAGTSEDNPSPGHGHGSKPQFSPHDRQVIEDYFRDYSNLPPGLAKRGGNLPPGLERQLRRNGSLPPGLEKRVQPFPARLTRELPTLPDGYSRVLLGMRAIILDRANRIMDMMNIP